MVGNSGEVHDVRSRNNNLKIITGVIAGLLILIVIAVAIYFFAFHDNGKISLEFVPKPDNGNLIWFKSSEDDDGNIWANKISSFLSTYKNDPSGTKTKCGEDYIKVTDKKEIPCVIDVTNLLECSDENSRFGYAAGRGSPCVILMLRRKIGWEPEPYLDNEQDLNKAKENGMPAGLMDYIHELGRTNRQLSLRKLNTTWITCEGESPADRENIGELRYYFPGFNSQSGLYGGLPNMMFPYLEQEAYLDPFLFVKFIKPQYNVIIIVKCKAWAKNLERGGGIVTFELLIDKAVSVSSNWADWDATHAKNF